MDRIGVAWAIAAWVALVSFAPVTRGGEPAGGSGGVRIRAVDAPPLAVRGGVLMVKLSRDPDSGPWPSQVDALLLDAGDGSHAIVDHVSAPIACLQELVDRASREWVDPVRWLAPVVAGDASEAWALVRVPREAPPLLALALGAGEPLSVRAIDPIPPGELGIHMPAIGASPMDMRHATPQRRAPSEHFRARLAARGEGRMIEPGSGSAIDRLWAEAVADRWDAILASVAAADPLVAERLVRALAGVAVGTAEDGTPLTIGAWVVDPVALDALVASAEAAIRAAPGLPGAIAAANEVTRWLDAQGRVMAWTERRAPEGVVLGVVNAGFSHRVLEATWPGSAETTTMAVPSGAYMTFIVPNPAESDARVLFVDGQHQQWRLPVEPAGVPVAPPGLDFGPFLREATLADASPGRPSSAPREWDTRAILRRRPHGWELVVTSGRPARESGRDEVLVELAEAGVRLAITEGGPCSPVSMLTGDPVVGSAWNAMSLERTSEAGQWTALLHLPAAWMGGEAPAPGTLISIGVGRRIAGVGRFTPVRAGLPWNRRGHELTVDVGSWPLPAPQ